MYLLSSPGVRSPAGGSGTLTPTPHADNINISPAAMATMRNRELFFRCNLFPPLLAVALVSNFHYLKRFSRTNSQLITHCLTGHRASNQSTTHIFKSANRTSLATVLEVV